MEIHKRSGNPVGNAELEKKKKKESKLQCMLALLFKDMVRVYPGGHCGIEPSKSPFGAPVFFVKKSDGSLRLVCDCRELN